MGAPASPFQAKVISLRRTGAFVFAVTFHPLEAVPMLRDRNRSIITTIGESHNVSIAGHRFMIIEM